MPIRKSGLATNLTMIVKITHCKSTSRRITWSIKALSTGRPKEYQVGQNKHRSKGQGIRQRQRPQPHERRHVDPQNGGKDTKLLGVSALVDNAAQHHRYDQDDNG